MKSKKTAIARKTIVMAIMVVAVIIGAGALATSYLSMEPCQQQKGSATDAQVTNCHLSITVTLRITNATMTAGNNETVYVSVHNDKVSDNTVSLNGVTPPPHLNASNLAADTEILPPYQCGQSAWIVVYNESGLPVQLNDATPFDGICGSTSSGIPFQLTPHQTLTQDLSVGGYWHSSNATAPWEDATYS